MTGPTDPRRGPRLILDLSSGTAIIDGERIELPQKELQVLVELAAHPGDVVSTPDLIEGVWPDVPGMTPNDLYSHVSRLRRRIKDGKRGRRLIRNRRGFGYALDLAPEDIRIVEGLGGPSEAGYSAAVSGGDAAPGESAALDEQEMTDASEAPDVATHEEVPSEEVPRRLRPRLTTVVVIALIASLAVGVSWLAGYGLSRLSGPVTAEPVPTNDPEVTPQPQTSAQPERDNQKQAADGGRGPRGRGAKGRNEPSASVLGGARTRSSGGTSGTRKQASSGSKPSGSGSKAKSPPPPPQPDAQLFHLHNPDTGDRYMTVSSAVANQKQAAGYNLSVEGRVFSKQVDGAVAISLDDGGAYIYRSRDAAPDSVSVTELYRLAKSGDYFYTKSPSVANQAEAQGWGRALAGFVQ